MSTQNQESLQALEKAIDLGVNFIDTALGYGDGHIEELIGQVLCNNLDKRMICVYQDSTKAGGSICTYLQSRLGNARQAFFSTPRVGSDI